MPLRTDFSAMNCSLARALDQMGDPWVLLVLRECLLGAERFE
jgi:DNA-binding HxlR family transcriptional regulator